jgi:hypothetical protein
MAHLCLALCDPRKKEFHLFYCVDRFHSFEEETNTTEGIRALIARPCVLGALTLGSPP